MTPLRLADRLRKRSSIVTRKVVDEKILVPIQRQLGEQHCIYTLNEVGEWVWDHIDGQRTVRDLAQGVIGEFETTKQAAEADVRRFLGSLLEERLVEIQSDAGADG